MTNDIVNKLNESLENYNMTFLVGDSFLNLERVLSSLSKGDKITVLFSKKTAEKFSFKIDKISKTLKLINKNIILNNIADEANFIPTETLIEKIISLSTDCKTIIVFDTFLFNFASYLTQKINASIIFYISFCGYDEIISTHTLIKKSDGINYEKLYLYNKRYYIIDENFENNVNMPAVYSSIVNKLTDFTDYRLGALVKKYDIQKDAYLSLKNAVITAFNIENKENKPLTLFECKIMAEISNIKTNGNLSSFSSSKIAYLLSKIVKSCESLENPSLLHKILSLNLLCFSQKYENIDVFPDYIERTETLAKILNVDNFYLLQNMKKQCEIYKKYEKNINKFKKQLKKEIFEQEKLVSVIFETYLSLGGKTIDNDKNLIFSLKCAGDFYDTFNTITLIRNDGILELL